MRMHKFQYQAVSPVSLTAAAFDTHGSNQGSVIHTATVRMAYVITVSIAHDLFWAFQCVVVMIMLGPMSKNI